MALNKKILLLAIAAIVMAVIFLQSQDYPQQEANLMKSYAFLLADTPEKRNAGLSGKDSLPVDTVLLFSYEKDSSCSIWMKNMKFSIDVIWLDDKLTVISLKEGLSPGTYPRTFSPAAPCRYFIEAKAGFIQANNIRLNDKIAIDFASSLLSL